MKTYTRRELLGGLALALAAIPASSALGDSGSVPISLNQKTLEGINDPDGPMLEPDPTMENYRNDQRRQYEYFLERMGPYITTVPLGETYPLANIDEGIQPFVYWNGTIEVTVLAASLHPSIEDAQLVYDLKGIVEPIHPERLYYDLDLGVYATGNFELLVTKIQVTNVDAQSYDGSYYFGVETFQPQTIEEMHDGTGYEYLIFERAAFDSATQDVIPRHSSENRFKLLPGETKVMTIAHWVQFSQTKLGVTTYDKNPANIVLCPQLAANPSAYGPIRFDLGLPDYLEREEERAVKATS